MPGRLRNGLTTSLLAETQFNNAQNKMEEHHEKE